MSISIKVQAFRDERSLADQALRAGDVGLARLFREDARTVFRSLQKLTALAVLLLAVPVLAVVDTQLIGGGLSEYSITEIAQELLLVVAIVLFAVAARREPEVRGIMLLASGCFATMLVRELDHFWDKIFHGFWVCPALSVAAFTIYRINQERGSLITAWARFSHSRSHELVSIGLLFILVLSRTFGSQLMWKPILGNGDVLLTKTVVQEGLELLGYLLVFWGALEMFRKTPLDRSLGSEKIGAKVLSS